MKRIAGAFFGAIIFTCASRSAQADASDFEVHHESKQLFAFELRFEPYWPAIDSQPGLKGQPYNTIFGGSPRLLAGAELDVQVLRIPHFGSLGPAFSFGYSQVSALAPLASGAGLSGETTTLEVFPFYVVAVLRVDVLQRDLHIPFVPYAKAGVAMSLWRASNASGTSVYTDPSGNSLTGFGATWGEQFALGGMLSLDWLDRRGAGNLDDATGINHTYLFAEWTFANLDNFGSSSGLRVGTNTICGGLAFEF